VNDSYKTSTIIIIVYILISSYALAPCVTQQGQIQWSQVNNVTIKFPPFKTILSLFFKSTCSPNKPQNKVSLYSKSATFSKDLLQVGYSNILDSSFI
jgi:hypothetical protein